MNGSTGEDGIYARRAATLAPPGDGIAAVSLAPPCVAALRHLAATAWPREMVALLAGTRTGSVVAVERIWPCSTAATGDRFVVPARVTARLVLPPARRRHWQGLAHSHPQAGTGLSRSDRANLPPGLHLVLSVIDGHVRGIAAHHLREGGTALPVRLVPRSR